MKHDRICRRRIQLDLPHVVLLATASLALLLLAGETLFGAATVGVGGDDHTHLLMFDSLLEKGWYATSFGYEPEPGTNQSPFIYGSVFSVLAHVFNVWLGNEGLGEISTDAGAWEARHVLVALVGLTAVVCVGAAVQVLTRDRLAAIWSCAALLAIPVWTGNAMFNVKDIPVASGFTLVTVGLLLGLAWASQDARLSSRRMLSVGVLVALGTFIGVGTRPAMWVPFILSLVAFGALSWLVLRSSGGVLRSVTPPGIGFLIGLVGVGASHPYAAARPIDWLIGSVSDSSGFLGPSQGTLTAGEILSSWDPPVWYLPAWFFAGIPLIIFGFGAVGTVVVIRNGLRWRALRWRSNEEASLRPSRSQLGGMLLVIMQLVLLPTAAIVAGSSMYSGLRQHLYVLPAVAIVAGIGVARLLHATRVTGTSGKVRWAGAIVLTLALVVPTVEQTRLYPYNYVYVNPIAGLGGVQDRWETEFQFLSSREAFGMIPSSVEPACGYWLVPRQGPTLRPMYQPCISELQPFRDEVGDEARASVATSGEDWVVGRRSGDNHPPDYCREYDAVTRSLRTEEIVMSYVLRCNPNH